MTNALPAGPGSSPVVQMLRFMRLPADNPIVPLVGRMLKEPMRIGGLSLPAGVVAAPCIHLAHRRPDEWPDPERFEPERFLGRTSNPYTFFPFGGGVRRCLGMAFALYEMKIVLAQIVSRVELRPATARPVRAVPRSITLVPSGGMPVVVESRRPSPGPGDGSRAAA